MWVFADFGLLMPAVVPAKVQNREDVLKWTEGKYELQVRARLREHLEYFMKNFMEEGTYNPEIQATPDKDYNYRFYTTREAFGAGIGRVAMAMDYEKFKDSSDRYPWNKKYHTILTNIWAKLCELNQPGGIWGPRTKDNPRGYTKTWKPWNSYGTSRESWYENEHDAMDSNVRVGDSFGPRDGETHDWWETYREGNEVPEGYQPHGYTNYGTGRRPMAWEEDDRIDDAEEDSDSFTWLSDSDKKALEVIDELDDLKVPEIDWVDYASPGELAKVVSYLKRVGAKTAVERIMKGARERRHSKAAPTKRK